MGRQGFEIYKRFYPLPERFRMGDPVLVREVTGMSWPDFAEAYERMEIEAEVDKDDAQVDQIVLFGLAAVAFWQGNTQMSRDKVRRTLERVWQDDVELIAEDDEPDEADAVPPVVGGEQPPAQQNGSSNSQAADSETLIPSSSGSPGSDIGSPVSPLTG